MKECPFSVGLFLHISSKLREGISYFLGLFYCESLSKDSLNAFLFRQNDGNYSSHDALQDTPLHNLRDVVFIVFEIFTGLSSLKLI